MGQRKSRRGSSGNCGASGTVQACVEVGDRYQSFFSRLNVWRVKGLEESESMAELKKVVQEEISGTEESAYINI